MSYRVTADIGGTFTDVVVVETDGDLVVGKAPTTPERAFTGVSEALADAASRFDRTTPEVLADTDLFVYSTTRATNAIVERTTAKTALLTTAGFPDVLVLREGGKSHPFDLDIPYPEPYVPRRFTFELPERVDAEGGIVTPLDEEAVRRVARGLAGKGIEAVAVCLLWSVTNPAHEVRVGEILAEELPGVPYTLSHQLNPVVREYRRASATAIDASLKPLMGAHLRTMADDLGESGFAGQLFAATSFGGVMHVDDLATQPIFSVKSGPALAPVAGTTYAGTELAASQVVVCDMGGTSFDVSVARDGEINFTRETWLGERFLGHLIATPSVDVRSVGSGGGSIAWVDDGGLLRVGPQSAGAQPGPACYGRGGQAPTVTDAAVVLGYLTADRFLGGQMSLNADAAHRVVAELAGRLGLDPLAAADAILAVACERMVGAISDITVNEGLDPRESVVVAGGGAAGLTIGRIAAELGCRRVLVPRAAGVLSAVGGQHSDIVAEFTASCPTTTTDFDFGSVNRTLDGLDARADEFAATLAQRGIPDTERSYLVEARYAFQVWDIELTLPNSRFDSAHDVAALSTAFDTEHERIFAVAEPGQTVETLTWRLRVRASVGAEPKPRLGSGPEQASGPVSHTAYFSGHGVLATPVYSGADMAAGSVLEGPAIVADDTSTLVLHPEWRMTVTDGGNYLMEVRRS